MTIQEFEARIAAFYQIDRNMLSEVTEGWWHLFKANPLGFFRIATDSEREAIWRASDKILEERARAAA